MSAGLESMLLSSLRKQGPSIHRQRKSWHAGGYWTPAFAGVTVVGLRAFQRPFAHRRTFVIPAKAGIQVFIGGFAAAGPRPSPG
jgi:hypothetical protein